MKLKYTVGASLAFGLMAGAAQAQTEIEWWHAMGGQLGETVNQMAENFNASQDEYVITPVFKGTYEETLTSAIAAFRAGEQPNIVQVFDAGAATVIAAQGATIPVETLMADNGYEFDREEFISGVRNFYADSDGMMIGMPFNSSTPVLYYNADALAEAGVEPPQTYEDFEEIAPALLEAGYAGMSASLLQWTMTENFFSRHNLPFATNDNGYGGTDVELLVNHPAIVDHFTSLAEWEEAGYYNWYGAGWGDNQNPFEAGEVAMWIGSSGSFGGIADRVDFNFGATFLPYWESVTSEPTQTFIGGAALFAMSGQSEEENAATAAFFDYLASAENQVFWHVETGYVPITTEAYELAAEQGHYEEFPAAEVGIQQLQLPSGENTRGYRLGFYVQIRDVMIREYSRIIAGETTAEDAFATIEEEANELLARFAQTQG
ncbi:extracellular solute-binding protein [Gymnodinialimonas ceratoperidinii]|uniref:sn-glycerol-3-phosphate-binding periplasmic protein UgpB n=1 Tax=Gymnodinialimonas ceratoperidinii TaxID=2856823 RepID=A0A8F6TUV8_9RHOB|nr:extracellular solute-binding protein [Gymnodinialimonas ceratoperidinii]QXT38177.1 extracellular solute-binding protein [Gymnodinialimonas ceratoperidinii]